MKRGSSSLEEVTRILDAINQECERLLVHARQVKNISPDNAERLLTRAKAIAVHLQDFRRVIRDEVGLSQTNRARRQPS